MKILIAAYLNPLQFCSSVLSFLYFSPVLFSLFPHFFEQFFFIAGRVYHTNSSTLPSAGRGLAQPSVWPPASWRVQQSWSSRHRSCLVWQEESVTTSLPGRTEKTGKNLNLRKVVDIQEEVTKKHCNVWFRQVNIKLSNWHSWYSFMFYSYPHKTKRKLLRQKMIVCWLKKRPQAEIRPFLNNLFSSKSSLIIVLSPAHEEISELLLLFCMKVLHPFLS